MSKTPKVTGAPDAIWLVYGELEHDDTHAAIYRDGEISWCQDTVFDSDVKYVRADLATPQPPHTEAPAAQDEREAFEAWCCKRWGEDRGALVRREDGEYLSGQVEFAWQATLAARAPQAAPAPRPEATIDVESAIQTLCRALAASRGWTTGYADAVVRDAIDRRGAQSEAAENERAVFEQWAHANSFDTHRDATEKYRDYHRATTRFARQGWEAALAWRTQSSEQPEVNIVQPDWSTFVPVAQPDAAEPVPAPVQPVYLVATGEVYEGRETYTRHDTRPALCDAEPLFSAPPVQPQPEAAEPVPAPVQPAWARIEAAVDDYLDDYELCGEDEQGRDGCHTPTEEEVALIKDAIMGLLVDDEFVAANVAQPIAPAQQSVATADMVQRLQEAIEGECDGIAVDEYHARAMLDYVLEGQQSVENDAARWIPPEIAAIAERLHTQDNRITQDPLFAVQQKRRVYGVHHDYCDNSEWIIDGETWTPEGDEGPPDGARRVGFIDKWEFVTGCLTEQGCKDFVDCNGHNLREPRIYAYGSYRNAEWIALRGWLMSLRGAALAQQVDK